MSSVPKRPLPALSKVLVEGFPDPGEFEGVPRVRKVSPESTEPYTETSYYHEREANTPQPYERQSRYRNRYALPLP
jgi:hypothetical protein